MDGLLGEEVFLLLEVPVVFALTGLLLVRYAAGHGRLSWFVVGLAWFLSLLIPALLSLDVAEALSERCHLKRPDDVGSCPRHTAQSEVIRTAWYFIYWLSFILSWFVLPTVASYSISGAFGPLKKLRCALRDRLLLWGSSLVFTLLCSGVLILQFNFTWFALMGILESLVNSFGLLVVIVMLGHGLVEVPKQLWNQGDHERRLRAIEYRVTEFTDRIDDARLNLATVLGQVEATRRLFDKIRSELRHEESKPLSQYLAIIDAEIPVSDGDLIIPKPISAEPPAEINEFALEQLRKQLKTRVIEFRRVNYIWQCKCQNAFALQDLLIWKKAEYKRGETMKVLGLALRSFGMPLLSRLLAVLALTMSALVVFTESTVWSIISPLNMSLSPFDYLVHLPEKSVLYVQIISFCVVSYMALCTFYSLFRFKLFHVYELVPHYTDMYTLFLNSMLCCRIAPVIAYNFLTIIHETSFAVDLMEGAQSPRTSFSFIARSMEEIPFFGVGFNLYFPSLLLIFIVINFTNFWSWLLVRFGGHFTKLGFDGSAADDDRKRGRRVLAVERRRWARHSLVSDLPDDFAASMGEEQLSGYFDIEEGSLSED